MRQMNGVNADRSRWTRSAMGGLLAAALLSALAAPAHADDRAPAAAASGVVNINTATVEQLSLLPGIGASKARAIVAHRQRRPFARVEDLVAVRGIGRSTLRRLRPYLAIRGDTTLTRAVPTAPRAEAAQTPAAAARGTPGRRR